MAELIAGTPSVQMVATDDSALLEVSFHARVLASRSITSIQTVEVRYFAAARSAVGRDTDTLEIPAGTTVADLATLLAERNGADFATVVGRCSYLMDEVAVRNLARPLPAAAVVDVLPPFAGG